MYDSTFTANWCDLHHQSLQDYASWEKVKYSQNLTSKFRNIAIADCADEFETATLTKLDDLFANAEEELPEFFKIKSDIFKMDSDGTVCLQAGVIATTQIKDAK